MSFRDFIKNNFIVGLSPMDGITDEPYRQTQCYLKKPDVLFTEFVSAEGISRGGVKLYDVLLYKSNERPIIGQLFGKDPESFYKAAVILSHLGFDGIDINMGCPAKTVTQHGSGAALIATPDLASEIIKSAKQGINDYFSRTSKITRIGLKNASLEIINRNLKYSDYTPDINRPLPTLSVKTRLGITENIITSWLPRLLTHNLDFISLHGRTLKQGYAGFADWPAIKTAAIIASQSHTPLWGNGDIHSLSQADEYKKKYHVSGVLIGRASMGNPWIFTGSNPTWADKFSLMTYHAQKFKDVFPQRRFDPLRKHFLLYASGHPRAKELRSKLVHINSLAQLYALEEDFLNC